MNIKCNICGGDVTLSADKTFATCEYCGSTITVPKVSDEQRAASFNRGNHFRRIGEFDKALASYERILRDDDTDAEAHWCAALCRFGIEYVEDPATYEWIPTCHRASFDSFTEDVDFKAALEYSDGLTRRLYQKEAAKIAEVQKGILATSQNEEPYDVFICYKETGEDGQRTKDSILAQDIYYQLTDQGHRVFFSRITLENKAGSEYEPYIFAALNSAKVMVAVGTKPEHFSAVWVKNEWSRFLALMRKDRSRVLLPCYRDMDPYDLPEQLAVLQSYDMGKIGFIQDLIHGVDKVVKAGKAVPAAVVQQVRETVQTVGSNADALVERGFMALEDQEWQKADQFFEDALNQNARFAKAYLGKFLAEHQALGVDDFVITYLAKTDKAQAVKKVVSVDLLRTAKEVNQKYRIPGHLETSQILAAFKFNCSYSSTADDRQKQLDGITQLLQQDKNLTRAEQFGDADTKAQIAFMKNGILEVMRERLEKAVATEETDRDRIKSAEEQHRQNAVEQIRRENERIRDQLLREEQQRREEEQQRREEELRVQQEQNYAYAENWVRRAASVGSFVREISCLESAAEKFDAAGDFRDASAQGKQCREKIQNLESTIAECKRKGCCIHCGGEFRGLFKKFCAVCEKEKDY